MSLSYLTPRHFIAIIYIIRTMGAEKEKRLLLTLRHHYIDGYTGLSTVSITLPGMIYLISWMAQFAVYLRSEEIGR